MKSVNLKLKAMLLAQMRRGVAPRDAMDATQRNTRKEHSRDDLRDAADAAITEMQDKGQGADFWWMEFV